MLLRDKTKKCGVLLAVSSLPSNYGIGTFGIKAYEFVDFLCDTKQNYWQMLPLVPLGEGNSPYKSPSCYAGEILYIDLDFLVRDRLLSFADLEDRDFGKNVDFEAVRKYKIPLIKKAIENFNENNEDYKTFLKENEYWLNDYALFMTALEVYETEFLYELPDKIKLRDSEFLNGFYRDNFQKIKFYKISQYFFYAQFFELKRYANSKNIEFIGDIPFYVSPDSADVWANPENFMLKEDYSPSLVAGVPPDMFSSTGQLWGNPIYNFEYLKTTGYEWWINRLKHYFKVFDVVRIDHFRAFADYYTIKAGSENAMSGEWKTGAGCDFWKKAERKIPNMNIIAEDLGGETGLVKDLLKETGFPNMKVLQFAFSGDPCNPHLPSNFGENCFCYTGTHDNNTTLGFLQNALPYEKEMIENTAPETEDLKAPYNLIDLAMKSNAKTVIIPMQDWLKIGEEGRMNTPGTPKGNWTFRLKNDYITVELKNDILRIAQR